MGSSARNLTSLHDEEEKALKMPREETAHSTCWRMRPPPAAGIGNAVAAIGRMAASQARHSTQGAGA